jgi:ATP-dependent exoDNAse (exonuclease V) beta subunit
MAFVIPDNLKSRKDVPGVIRRVVSALQIGLDDDVTVWYEPPYDPTGEKPHLVVLLPGMGVVVLEILNAQKGGLLAGELRQLLVAQENVEVVHLDRLMATAIREAKMKHPGFDNDDDGEKVAGAALQALERGAGPRYRGVLLDEAQDFSTSALKFAVGLLEPGQDDFVVVADAAQNIFRRKFSWRQAGIQAQGRTRILRKNYRNTKEILEFASQFLLASKTLHFEEVPDEDDSDALISPEAAVRSGERPSVKVLSTIADEVRETVSQVESWLSRSSAKPKSIAVLYASAKQNRAAAIHEGLIGRGIDVFWLNDPKDKDARDRLAEAKAPVVLSTIYNAKGLEFPRVLLCGIWTELDGGEDVNRRLSYVGMTRATDELAVVSVDGNPLIADLRQAKERGASS